MIPIAPTGTTVPIRNALRELRESGTDCKAVYIGSIPFPASNILYFRLEKRAFLPRPFRLA